MTTSDYRDPRDEFAAAVKAAGLVLDETPLMDGNMHRVPVEGAKAGKKDGAYVGYLDGKPSGFIQNFATGYKENWTASGVRLTGQERVEAAAQMHMARQEREVALAAQHRQTADKVLVKWEGLSDMPPSGKNAYLTRKGVEAHGVRFDGERLVVPVRDVDGKLWSVQTISPDEGAPKLFEKGGRKGANMHVIGEIKPGAEVLVAEGYATGASLHQATGKPVAVAFDSGNLDAVVGAIKQRHPTSPIYIMGDDDRAQMPNVGYDKAMAAARNHQVGVAFPRFQEPGDKLTDFNDLHAKEGLTAVRAQAEKATSLSMEQSREQAALTLTAARPSIAERSAPSIATEMVADRSAEVSPMASDRATSASVVPVSPVKSNEIRDPSEQLTSRDAVIGAAHAAQLGNIGGPAATTAVQAIGIVDAAKVASDMVQGKEVKALDVASAAASVTMTAGVGGPAVQLGAQAVAGISAVDALQRTVNTVETKLNEPAAADVEKRKAIEERQAQLLAQPRNSLDEQSASMVVKQDVAAWDSIDDASERRAATLAMRSNADSQSNYKAALAQHDPHAAEAVALARTTDRQPGAREQTNSIEKISPSEIQSLAQAVRMQVDPEADRGKPQPKLTPLEDRFNIVNRFGRGRDYYFRDQPGKVAFEERWRSMTSTVDTPAVVKAMIDRAQERGWEALRLKGSEEFKRQAWIAATVRGIKAVGYEPTQGDRAAVVDERTRLGQSPARTGGTLERTAVQQRSGAERSAVDSPNSPTRYQGATQGHQAGPQAVAPSKATGRESVDLQAIERADQSKPAPQPDVERPIAPQLRTLLTERGMAAAEVEATVALASERMPRDRVVVGQLVAHGTDHYEFDKKNEKNHYVKLQTASGEKIVWGVDLRRALEEAQLRVGDNVALEHRGQQPVTVTVKDYDGSGKQIGVHEDAATRNTWYAVNVEQLRREATRAEPVKDKSIGRDQGAAANVERSPATAKAQAPEQVKERSPDVAQSMPRGRLNGNEALIAQALEALLDLQRIPQEERPNVRAAVRKDLDVRMALGKPAQVAIYDPAAPAREPQRKVELIVQRQQKEQERSR